MLTTDIKNKEFLEHSPIDSHRFGLEIYRMHANILDGERIRDQIIKNQVDTAIIRIPSKNLYSIDSLIKISMPFMVADTLIQYNLDLKEHQPKALSNEKLNFIWALPEHHTELNKMVAESFGTHSNHYRNNPIFNNKLVLIGYQDWINSYAVGDSKKHCFIVDLEGEYIGFATFKFENNKHVKGVLYGVNTHYRRHHIFTDIMRYIIGYAKEKGYEKIQVLSQIENTITQKVWLSEGFLPFGAINTIHVNAMLSKTVLEKVTIPFKIKKDELKTAKVTNRFILKSINKQFDVEQNIITSDHRFVNIKPLQPDKDYILNFSFPTASMGLLQITDKEKETLVIVYFYLKHFLL